MNEKRFKQSEINEITNKIYMYYMNMFSADKMEFKDLMLVENVIIKIQYALNDFEGDLND